MLTARAFLLALLVCQIGAAGATGSAAFVDAIAKSDGRAVAAIREAAEGGELSAKILAAIFIRGHGAPRDLARAASQGHVVICHKLLAYRARSRGQDRS